VNKNQYREFMIQKVVPVIIAIQQDGASAHIDKFDPAFFAVATTGNWNITLMTQSPKSPDLNVLDLSFFWATGVPRRWTSLLIQ
jgi:hypothetical protein